MARRVSPEQLKSMIRQAEAKQRQAVSQYNAAARKYNAGVRKQQQAISTYNREARAHNARVRANRQRLASEIARLQSSRSTTRYTVAISHAGGRDPSGFRRWACLRPAGRTRTATKVLLKARTPDALGGGDAVQVGLGTLAKV